ncbi:MAG: AraC family transcriptional regulator [Tenericutes bacterium]|nr:AraC family transcriptional regulator [Mycoplasmatota bacterium]
MEINPYVRFAMHHVYLEGYYISRQIWDHEIIYIEEGSMKITIDGKLYIVKKDDVIILRPGVPHIIEWNNEDCKQPHVHFDFFEQENSSEVGVSLRNPSQMNYIEKNYFREDYLSKNSIDLPYVFHLKQSRIVKTLIYKIIDEYEYKFQNYQIVLKGLLIQLFAYILRDYRLGQIKNHHVNVGLLDELVEYMVENSENSLTLDDFVDFSGIGKWELNHVFKEGYLITPMRYYNNLRLSKAKNLIMFSGLSIKQVAYKMNFDSPQTFSRWFKNLDEHPPVFYKQN